MAQSRQIQASSMSTSTQAYPHSLYSLYNHQNSYQQTGSMRSMMNTMQNTFSPYQQGLSQYQPQTMPSGKMSPSTLQGPILSPSLQRQSPRFGLSMMMPQYPVTSLTYPYVGNTQYAPMQTAYHMQMPCQPPAICNPQPACQAPSSCQTPLYQPQMIQPAPMMQTQPMMPAMQMPAQMPLSMPMMYATQPQQYSYMYSQPQYQVPVASQLMSACNPTCLQNCASTCPHECCSTLKRNNIVQAEIKSLKRKLFPKNLW